MLQGPNRDAVWIRSRGGDLAVGPRPEAAVGRDQADQVLPAGPQAGEGEDGRGGRQAPHGQPREQHRRREDQGQDRQHHRQRDRQRRHEIGLHEVDLADDHCAGRGQEDPPPPLCAIGQPEDRDGREPGQRPERHVDAGRSVEERAADQRAEHRGHRSAPSATTSSSRRSMARRTALRKPGQGNARAAGPSGRWKIHTVEAGVRAASSSPRLRGPVPTAARKPTFWPSLRPRRPARSTALTWTKTSLPPSSGWMKPKPLVVLNHLTVPFAISGVSLLNHARERFPGGARAPITTSSRGSSGGMARRQSKSEVARLPCPPVAERSTLHR